jgi:hypothetical protein
MIFETVENKKSVENYKLDENYDYHKKKEQKKINLFNRRDTKFLVLILRQYYGQSVFKKMLNFFSQKKKKNSLIIFQSPVCIPISQSSRASNNNRFVKDHT